MIPTIPKANDLRARSEAKERNPMSTARKQRRRKKRKKKRSTKRKRRKKRKRNANVTTFPPISAWQKRLRRDLVAQQQWLLFCLCPFKGLPPVFKAVAEAVVVATTPGVVGWQLGWTATEAAGKAVGGTLQGSMSAVSAVPAAKGLNSWVLNLVVVVVVVAAVRGGLVLERAAVAKVAAMAKVAANAAGAKAVSMEARTEE
mmetsp:Transcript_19978/g.39670  ORF Transcript_19978/g.39670 Transcript_19978/m.39670 type:complete len:201 (+) Transcript_19978:635-1237(+)